MNKLRTTTILVLALLFLASFTNLLKVQSNIALETHSVETIDNVKIVFDIYFKHGTDKTKTPIILLVHGFSANRKTMKTMALEFTKNGFISVCLDLRGHGDSEGYLVGWPTNQTKLLRYEYFEKDINAVLDYMKNNGYNTSRIVMIGHSMGGATVLYYASKHDNVIATIPIAPGIVPDGTVNTSYPRNLLIISSKKDRLVPITYVQQLLEEAIGHPGEPNKLYNISGNLRMLYLDDDSSHMSEALDQDIIRASLNWVHMITGFGDNKYHDVADTLKWNSLIAMFSGVLLFYSILPYILKSWGVETKVTKKKRFKGKIYAINYSLMIILSPLIGGFISTILAYLLLVLSKLVIADMITALLLGSSIGQFTAFYIAKNYILKDDATIKDKIKALLKKEDYKLLFKLTLIYGFIVLAIPYMTLGLNITLTFTTSKTHFLYLPALLPFIFLAFFLDEILFRYYLRPRFASRILTITVSAVLYTIIRGFTLALSIVTFSIINGASLPFMMIGFWVIFTAVPITAITSEFIREYTGNILTQTIINTVMISLLTITFTPAIMF